MINHDLHDVYSPKIRTIYLIQGQLVEWLQSQANHRQIPGTLPPQLSDSNSCLLRKKRPRYKFTSTITILLSTFYSTQTTQITATFFSPLRTTQSSPLLTLNTLPLLTPNPSLPNLTCTCPEITVQIFNLKSLLLSSTGDDGVETTQPSL